MKSNKPVFSLLGLIFGLMLISCGASPGQEGGSCVDGTTCEQALSCHQGNTCIADRSLQTGEACDQDIQCASDDCEVTCRACTSNCP